MDGVVVSQEERRTGSRDDAHDDAAEVFRSSHIRMTRGQAAELSRMARRPAELELH